MTLICYLFAAVAFAIAAVLPLPLLPHQVRFVALGLFLWLLPSLLTAAHVAHS